MSAPVALITGVTGQDGAYLAELLLAKGYVVHGVKRRSSSFNTARVDHLYRDPLEPGRRFFLHYGDLADGANLIRLVAETAPDEIYNLGAESHVQVSFELPQYTADVNGPGTLRLLEALRILEVERSVRFYQAPTSELYGNAGACPQEETTPFAPRSPYATAVRVLGHYAGEEPINIGAGEDVTVAELAGHVRDVTGYSGTLTFDASKPDGAPRKLLDVSRMRALGWGPGIGLREGPADTYRWFLGHAAAA